MGIGATGFPTPLTLSGVRDEELVREVFSVVAKETRTRGRTTEPWFPRFS